MEMDKKEKKKNKKIDKKKSGRFIIRAPDFHH